ncbi:hypothetical protein P3L10_025275 [Capsicum annuum]
MLLIPKFLPLKGQNHIGKREYSRYGPCKCGFSCENNRIALDIQFTNAISITCDHSEDFSALHEKISSLEVFLKNFVKNNVSGEMTDLELQVKEVANIVEHTIQVRVTEVLEDDENLREKAQERLSDSLLLVAEDIDRIWKESTKIQNKGKHASKESTAQEFPRSSRNILNVENSMVGCDDQRKWLVQDLTRSYSGEPKVIPIVGMGGIGDTFDMNDEAELANMLQKSLKGKRYLIVLDDMWKSEAWDAVRLCFPSENKGSGILLTTRNTDVARDAGTKNLSLQMDLMGLDESWNLFKSVAFANVAFPSEFETIGKQIADEYHGLPLTIAVVAGLLKSKRAIENWKSVEEDVKSFVSNDPDERCSRVVGLSYDHLTSVLKACLLHFGIFPEGSEIPVKNLMRSWMAEGFLKLENDLEGEAETCLQELVDRCLVLVCKKSLDGTKIRSCKVHDLIYGLCLREIQRGNVFIMNNIVLYVADPECLDLSMHKMRPFKRMPGDLIDNPYFGLYRALLTPVHRQLRDHDNNDLLKQTCSIFSFHLNDSCFILKSELIHFKLLKVLVLRDRDIDNFPLQILSLIWLRYLSLVVHGHLLIPPEICRLWNLQTLVVKEDMGFSNLQTTSRLSSCCCTREVIMGIQNVKKLEISGDEDDYESFWESGLVNNLVHLHQLETLSLNGTYILWPRTLPASTPSAKSFPTTLKKLNLTSTYLSWSYLDIIAELPNLEVLKLMGFACCGEGEEWHPIVMGFNRLKILLIERSFLKYWKATDDNFPVLERLVLINCKCLKEIPIEFAEIHSLQLIEVDLCLIELGESAARIRQQQQDLGNNPLDVRISHPRTKCSWKHSLGLSDDPAGCVSSGIKAKYKRKCGRSGHEACWIPRIR